MDHDAGGGVRTQEYLGDTHMHTSNSGDAFLAGDQLGPEQAYRFDRGEDVHQGNLAVRGEASLARWAQMMRSTSTVRCAAMDLTADAPGSGNAASAREAPAMATIGPLLQQRRFNEARPLLETLLQLQPEHPEGFYNLGVLASEEGRLKEARLLLRRVVVANAPDAHAQANAQVALALAAMRLGDKAEARQALEAAIEVEPGNSFALRSIGSLLVIAGAYAAAVERFRQALKAAPDDLITTFNLAQALLELDPDEHRNEADRLLLRVIEAQPYGKLAAKAKDLRSRIARRDLRADQPDGLRQDAVSYCLQALQLFEGMDQQRFMAVLSEVAAVGQGGLQINEPGTSRSLKTLPGSWSDLALACLIHVGM